MALFTFFAVRLEMTGLPESVIATIEAPVVFIFTQCLSSLSVVVWLRIFR